MLVAYVIVLYRFLFIRPSTPHKDESVTDEISTRARVPYNIIITARNSDGVFTKMVLDLIQENLEDPEFDVHSIAARTGLSRIHVNRKLKAEGSPSPSVLLKAARMELASKLLQEGRLSIREVGISCGFSRPAYFATAFKEYFGVTPTEYIGSQCSKF